MAMRNFVDDFRQDGGVPPRQSLRTGDTTIHTVVTPTCPNCGYVNSANVASGTNKKTKMRCANCNYEIATGL